MPFPYIVVMLAAIGALIWVLAPPEHGKLAEFGRMLVLAGVLIVMWLLAVAYRWHLG
jgi:hypothetical protein